MENIELLKKYLIDIGYDEESLEALVFHQLHSKNIIAVSFDCPRNASTFIYHINGDEIICLHEIYEC